MPNCRRMRGRRFGRIPCLRPPDPAVSRKSLNLADCASFEVMRALGLMKALAFDPRFTEKGFSRIP